MDGHARRPRRAQLVATGKLTFPHTCYICHGDAAVGSGVVPDLRYSAAILSPAAWKMIVMDGSLKSRGMVSFALVLSATETEAIRAHVIGRANDAFEEQQKPR